MWLKVTQFRVGLDIAESGLILELARQYQLPADSIKQLKIQRKSLDARHKSLAFIYTLLFKVEQNGYELEALLARHPEVSEYFPEEIPVSHKKNPGNAPRPVIIGAGPAGLFAGLRLAAAGFMPLIIERGDGLTARVARVNAFWDGGVLDPESNIQYGIGGAGTFSDGKLTTRVKHPLLPLILENLIQLGAPPEISYWQYPHIGTDLLRHVITNLEQRITEYGGEVCFRHKLTDLRIDKGRVTGIIVNGNQEITTNLVLLATGNSARDIYELLLNKGIPMEAKPFAVGLRIEHPQEIIDRAQYGKWVGHPRLGAAEYHLTYKHPASGRGVYSFCMCPGGVVVGATSIVDGVVTNGMSYHARNSGIANAAIVVTVNQRDFGSASPLAGMYWQQQLEQTAYRVGGGNYFAPTQRVADFLKNEPSTGFTKLNPSYRPGTVPANLREVLPAELCQALGDGINYFDRKIKGFGWPDAVLTGVETRTSAPVRILRNEARETSVAGLYPIGEGAGYAGGIISSALDGWRTAEVIIEKYGN